MPDTFHPYRDKKRRKKKSAFLRLVKIKLARVVATGMLIPPMFGAFIVGGAFNEGLIALDNGSVLKTEIKSELTSALDRSDIDLFLAIAALEQIELAKIKAHRFEREINAETAMLAWERELCAPMFFRSKLLVAHDLLKVTCLDKAGKRHTLYKASALHPLDEVARSHIYKENK
jgi:hypothetical protein